MRDNSCFAGPTEVLAAVKLFADNLYGGMLWRLDSPEAHQVMRCWNTTVKDVWGLDRATYTARVRWLASPHSSLREDLLSRWVKYFQSCVSSRSPEVCTIARIAAGDLRITTGSNNRLISDLGLDPFTTTTAEVREKIQESKPQETEEQMARLGLLLELLQRRGEDFYKGEEKDGEINELIDFLCTA